MFSLFLYRALKRMASQSNGNGMEMDDGYPLTQVDQENKGSRSRKRKDRASESEQSPAKKPKGKGGLGGKSGRKNPVADQLEAAGDGKEDAKASPKAVPKEKKAPAPYDLFFCDFCWDFLTPEEIDKMNWPLIGKCYFCGIGL